LLARWAVGKAGSFHLKRVFGDDLLRGPCGWKRQGVAFIPEPKQAHEILAALKIEAPPLRIAKARPPPHQERFAPPRDDGGVDPAHCD
jgi:hypothetical protein